MKKIAEYFTFITIGAFIFSYLNLYTLYEQGYGIEVSTYFDATEIIFSSASLYFIVGFTAIALLALLIVSFVLDELKKNNEPQTQGYNLRQKLIIGFVVALSCGYLVYGHTSVKSEPVPHSEEGVFATALMMLIICLFMLSAVFFEIKSLKPPMKSIAIFCAAIVLSYFALQAKNTAIYRNRIAGFNSKNVYLELSNNETLKSSDSLHFVGANSKYFFFVTTSSCDCDDSLKNVGWATYIVPVSDVRAFGLGFNQHNDKFLLKK